MSIRRPLFRRPRLLMVGIAAVLVVFIAVALALIQPPTTHGPQIGDPETAVALGILDQAVVDGVRADGQAIGIVAIDWAAVAQRLEALAGRGLGAAELAAARVNLAGAKQRLFEALAQHAELVRDFEHLSSVVLRFRTEEALLIALRLPFVTAIRADKELVAFVDESRRVVRQPEASEAGYRGAGAYVAVLDTGVDTSDRRYFPAGSVARSYRAGTANGSALPDGHGTHVASTILAMAPDAKIVDVEVFRHDWWHIFGPQASSTNILDGINHVVGLKAAYLADHTQCCNVVSMNLSLGDTSYHRVVCTDDYGLSGAFDHGIIPVVAAGNDAVDLQRVFHAGVGDPACARRALSVGASTDGTFASVPGSCEASLAVDVPASFSQVGETLQILAPGNCIVAAGGAKQGTSMAAPHVAGAVAVLAAAEPEAAMQEVWDALVQSGPPITDSRIDPPVTVNRLDIAAAVELLLTTSPPPASTPKPDSTPPVIRTLEAALVTGAQVQPSGSVSIRVVWNAIDDGGIARYELRMRTNGGDWLPVALPTPTAMSTTVALAPGATSQFGVAALDTAGNRADWFDGAELAIAVLGEDDAAITYTGTWTATSTGEALGGSVRGASEAGAEACLTFDGRYVGWISTRGPGRGTPSVTFDGRVVGSVALGTASSPRTLVYGRPADATTEHVLCVRVEGSGSQSTVDVDGFVVIR